MQIVLFKDVSWPFYYFIFDRDGEERQKKKEKLAGLNYWVAPYLQIFLSVMFKIHCLPQWNQRLLQVLLPSSPSVMQLKLVTAN